MPLFFLTGGPLSPPSISAASLVSTNSKLEASFWSSRTGEGDGVTTGAIPLRKSLITDAAVKEVSGSRENLVTEPRRLGRRVGASSALASP